MVIRSWLMLGAAGAALATSALADDLTISTTRTTPVSTSDANNGPGDVTIDSAGAVTVSSSGAAVTLDSGNTLSVVGAVTNTAASGAIGIQVLAAADDFAGVLDLGGTVTLSGTTGGNIGLLIEGPGKFNAPLTLGGLAFLSIDGAGSTGIAINAPMTGAVTLAGTVTAFGENATGVVTRADIDGSLVTSLGIFVFGTRTYDATTFDPQGGWGLAIGGDVGGGIAITGPVVDGDGKNQTSISTVGGKPAFIISPEVAGGTDDITIGIRDDSETSSIAGYSLINRGSIVAEGNDPGVSVTAMRIAGSGAKTVKLDSPNGLYNNGEIRASATSSSFLTATAEEDIAANATALLIGAGATIGTGNVTTAGITNEGSINASTIGNKGGTATAILIEAGASVPVLLNSSAITASSLTPDTTLTNIESYAIRDLSGSLRKIENSAAGTITATASATDGGSVSVAADLSAATGPITFMNAGSVRGDILFGTGDGNTLTIDGSATNSNGDEILALVAGSVRAAGAGTLDVDVVKGSLQTNDSELRDLSVGANGTVEFGVNKTTLQSPDEPLIVASGEAEFLVGSRVTMAQTKFMPDNGIYTMLSAADGITFGAFEETTSLPLPFLFNGAFTFDETNDPNNLYLSLQRKTAGELGLEGSLATIYEPAIAAARDDDLVGAGFLAIEDAAGVKASLATLLPSMGDGARALAIAVTSQTGGPIGARQRALVTNPREGLGFWGQQFYEDLNAATASTSASYFGSGLGAAMGVEWGVMETGRFGAGYTHFQGQVTESQPRASKVNVGLNMFSMYGGWSLDDFFVTAQANGGVATFKGSRIAFTGPIKRTAVADWMAYLATGGVTTGMALEFGPVTVVPHVSVDGFYLYQAAYGEHGGGDGVDLHVGARDLRSVRVFAGVIAQSEFMFYDGVVQPQVLAGWTRELLNDTPTIDASFQAVPGSPFSLVGPTADPTKLIGGANLHYIFDNWSAGVNYDAAHTSGTFAQSATLTLTSRF